MKASNISDRPCFINEVHIMERLLYWIKKCIYTARKNAWENPQEIFELMNSLGKPLYLIYRNG